MADSEFKEKLKSLHFGVVPGASKSQSSTYYDKDALMDQLGHPDGRGSTFSKERVEDARSDVRARTKEFLDAADG